MVQVGHRQQVAAGKFPILSHGWAGGRVICSADPFHEVLARLPRLNTGPTAELAASVHLIFDAGGDGPEGPALRHRFPVGRI